MSPKVKDEIKRKTRSIKIDPNLWKDAKIEAVKREEDLSDLVEGAIRKELGKLKRLRDVKNL